MDPSFGITAARRSTSWSVCRDARVSSKSVPCQRGIRYGWRIGGLKPNSSLWWGSWGGRASPVMSRIGVAFEQTSQSEPAQNRGFPWDINNSKEGNPEAVPPGNPRQIRPRSFICGGSCSAIRARKLRSFIKWAMAGDDDRK